MLSRFQIDDELKLLRLLDGKISRLSSFQDLVDQGRYTLLSFNGVQSIGHEASSLNMNSMVVHHREAMFFGKLDYSLLMRTQDRSFNLNKSIRSLFFCCLENALEFSRAIHFK